VLLARRVDIGDVEIEADFANGHRPLGQQPLAQGGQIVVGRLHDVERVNTVGSDTAGIARHRFTRPGEALTSTAGTTMVSTPAARAAACASRSASNSAASRWQWVSISIAGRKSGSGRVPLIISASAAAEPQDMVQPSVPWPVFSHRLPKRVRPMSGTLDGVAGRRPHHSAARHRLQMREELTGALQQGLAAHRVEIEVVTVEFRRAGDAQAIAEARENQFALVVGQADRWRQAAFGQGERGRIALGRIDRQRIADLPQQQGRIAAQRHDVGIGRQQFRPVAMADDDPANPAAIGGNTLDGRSMAELDAGRLGLAARPRVNLWASPDSSERV
jgi:hypothetical protein